MIGPLFADDAPSEENIVRGKEAEEDDSRRNCTQKLLNRGSVRRQILLFGIVLWLYVVVRTSYISNHLLSSKVNDRGKNSFAYGPSLLFQPIYCRQPELSSPHGVRVLQKNNTFQVGMG